MALVRRRQVAQERLDPVVLDTFQVVHDQERALTFQGTFPPGRSVPRAGHG